jgi:hypothetical protein
MDAPEIERRFSYRPPCRQYVEKLASIQGKARALASSIGHLVPDSPGRAAAIEHTPPTWLLSEPSSRTGLPKSLDALP